MRYYADRHDAGRELSRALLHHAATDAVILALPRGGVPVADVVAEVLGAPLDILVVRKLGAPNQPELGMGAVAEGPRVDIDADLVDALGVTPHQLRRILRREAAEVRRRVARLRPDRPPADLRGRTAILVDDGLATGGTMRAAIRAVRKRGARRVVVAVPVGAPGPLAAMAHLADEVVCPLRPEDLFAIGAWYADFRQVSDDEVGRILGRSRLRPIAAPDGEPSPARP